MELKRCSKCEIEKDIEEFSWYNKAKSWRHSWCKKCKVELSKKWNKDNPERVKESDRRWREANPDKRNASNARYKARKRNQTIELTENEKAKIELYFKISQHLGKDWQVDHIHPLDKGGLHHPDNLQITTKKYNQHKNNNLNFRDPEPLEYFRM